MLDYKAMWNELINHLTVLETAFEYSPTYDHKVKSEAMKDVKSYMNSIKIEQSQTQEKQEQTYTMEGLERLYNSIMENH